MSEPRITRRKITDFQPDPANPNAHTERGIGMLEDSLAKVGLGRSIVVDRNGIVLAGNSTQERAVDQGFEDAIEVESDGTKLIVVKRTDLDLLNDKDNRARNLSYYDNRTAELGLAWSPEQLLSDMQTGVDLSKLWSADELAALLAGQVDEDATPDAGAQVDRAAELQAIWQVARGDVWCIGKHRLMCGDSTSAEDVATLMDGAKAELLFTSPPYSDQRDYEGGDLTVETLKQFIPTYRPHVNYMVVNLGIKRQNHEVIEYWNDYINAARSCGLKLLSWNVWNQGQVGSVGKLTAMFPIEHEFIFVFGEGQKDLTPTVPNKDGGTISNHTADRQSNGAVTRKSPIQIRQFRELGTVQSINVQLARNVDGGHPAMFPPELPNAYIEAMSHTGDIILDPFLGSGTTIVACEQTGRIGYGMEISPEYCSVVLQRLKDNGLSPERVS